VDSGYLERSPLLRRSGAGRVAIARNMPVEKREVWLTRPQLDWLVAATHARYRALVLVAALTGMRWGELVTLRWQDLRLDTPLNDGAVAGVGRVRITKAFSDPSRAGRGREKAPKTTAGRREIALDQETVDALRAQRDLVGGGDGELVFTTAGGSRGPGGRLSSNNFARIWRKALEQAELTDVWPEYGGLRFHDLRHTHATWLIARLVPPIAVAKRLGHASPVITMMVYAHVTELVQAGTLTTGDLGLTGPAPVVPLRPAQPSVS
jgi:integrase